MRKPVLAPGLRVLRRSRAELQVGLGPTPQVVLPDTDQVRRTLGHLVRGEAVPDEPAAREVLELLAPVLVDGAGLLVPDVAPGDVAAAALQDPSGYRARLAARRRGRVLVSGGLGVAAADPGVLLSAAGLRFVHAGLDDVAADDVVLVLRSGEIDRAELDPLLRNRVAHLPVRLVEGHALIGPFVEPGRTACLRCVDAHQALHDPRAPVLSAGHARAGDDRRDGVAEPADTALATLAVAWAVRDVVTHVEGDRPSTWSTTVRLAPALASVMQTEWLRHPACGCTWLPAFSPSDEHPSRTMAG